MNKYTKLLEEFNKEWDKDLGNSGYYPPLKEFAKFLDEREKEEKEICCFKCDWSQDKFIPCIICKCH